MSFKPLRSTNIALVFPSFPTVTTQAATSITASQATGNGTVVSDGGSADTVRGFVISTNPQPTLADTVVTSGSGVGVYTATLGSLAAGTTYHYRAYATNAIGTGYGDDVSFTTTTAASYGTSFALMGMGM